MAIALVVVSLALAVCLYLLLLGNKPGPSRHAEPARAAASSTSEETSVARSARPDAELEKRKKELEEQKKVVAEIKEELKQAKRKLYEQREAERGGDDLVKARAEVERAASLQLEVTRAELSHALVEIQKLKGEGEGKPRRHAHPVEAHPTPAAAVAAPAAPPVQKVIRELNEADREKMQSLEQQAHKERARAAELEKELRLAKARGDTHGRQLKTARAEGQLAKDKFRAVEMRLNRTLLERDLTLRAIRDLEKKSGMSADRVELTATEIAESDQRVQTKQKAEDQAEAEARARLEAQESNSAVAAPTPSAPEAPKG